MMMKKSSSNSCKSSYKRKMKVKCESELSSPNTTATLGLTPLSKKSVSSSEFEGVSSPERMNDASSCGAISHDDELVSLLGGCDSFEEERSWSYDVLLPKTGAAKFFRGAPRKCRLVVDAPRLRGEAREGTTLKILYRSTSPSSSSPTGSGRSASAAAALKKTHSARIFGKHQHLAATPPHGMTGFGLPTPPTSPSLLESPSIDDDPFHMEDDNGSLSTAQTQRRHTAPPHKTYTWIQKSAIPIRHVKVLSLSGTQVEISTFYKNKLKLRTLLFHTHQEALSFKSVLHGEQILESSRGVLPLKPDDDPPVRPRSLPHPSPSPPPPSPAPPSPQPQLVPLQTFLNPPPTHNQQHLKPTYPLHKTPSAKSLLSSSSVTTAVTTNTGKKIPVRFLFDIVSATDLKVGDFLSSDPYVVVKFHDKEIHRTKYLSKTLDPIWTVLTGSLFSLSTTAAEFFRYPDRALTFEIHDYDAFSPTHGFLGVAHVPPKLLFDADGTQRLEFPLTLPHEDGTFAVVEEEEGGGQDAFTTQEQRLKRKKYKGTLAIRCRRATDEDEQFLKLVRKEERPYRKTHQEHDRLIRPVGKGSTTKEVAGFMQRRKKMEHGVQYHRIRPGPDPNNPKQTEWMTHDSIESTTLQPSHSWVEAGTGTLGRVYLEILACDNLPNKDAGGRIGNLTDAFVTVIFEDTMVVTDVVDDCLNPRWLPWTQRAFVFHIMNPASPLYLGVFDYDVGEMDSHDGIGRVTVDVPNLTPNTECVLYYKLYKSARANKRKEEGTIAIRIRVEWEDDRAALLATLEPPPAVYINCRSRKDFEIAKYTCEGKYDQRAYNVKTIMSYIAEVQTYQLVWIFVTDAVMNVLLWRSKVQMEVPVPCFNHGFDWKKPFKLIQVAIPNPLRKTDRQTSQDCNDPQQQDHPSNDKPSSKITFSVPVLSINLSSCFCQTTFAVPLQSIMVFLSGVFLVERPHFLPSFSMACIAWLLLEVMAYRQRNPCAWRHCRGFIEFALVLVFGESCAFPRKIQPNENDAQIREYQRRWEARVELAEQEAQRRTEENLRRQEEYEKQIAELGEQNSNLDITTNSHGRVGNVSIDPLKPFLFPIQFYLAFFCNVLRVTRNIIIWDECYYSFWITVGSMVLSVAFLFVPWGFFLRWSTRIIIWAILGPWMKLLDFYYFSPLENLSPEEKQERLEEQRRVRQLVSAEVIKKARIKRENAEKLKDMKKFRYGDFIVQVPVLKLDRHRDQPMRHSYAKPYCPFEEEDEDDEEETLEQRVQSTGDATQRSVVRTRSLIVPGQQLTDGEMIPMPVDKRQCQPQRIKRD